MGSFPFDFIKMIDLKNFPPAVGNYLVSKSRRIAGLSKEQEFCH